MRIYLHDEKTGGMLEQICTKELGLDVLTIQSVRKRKKMPAQYDFFLDQVDVLIIEITKPNQDIQFILAQAILAQKPTLCVYGKNQPPRELLAYIKRKSLPRPVRTFSYTESTIVKALEEYIRSLDPDAQDHDNLPTVKFTLRLSPRIERYLLWYTKQHGISKADYLRELLEREVEDAKQYVDNPPDNSEK